jgi:hypothetical protein
MHSVVKWIRKNQRKLMAFFVIIIMIVFVGGTALTQLMSKMGAEGQTLGYFGEKNKIAVADIRQAQSDLNVLRLLMFDRLFHFGMRDLASRLLAQLLFPDSRIAAAMSDDMKKAVIQGQLKVSAKDIDVFFSQATGRSELLWILLKAEAKQAGCVVTNNQAKEILKQIVPQLTQGQADAKQLVDFIIKNHSIPEREIFRAAADLWAVMAYTRMIADTENVTIDQVRATIGREGEKIDSEFVRINASDFIAGQDEPADEELADQFERYKKSPPGRIDDRNPYGFGYEQPARITIEYLILKLDDARALVTEPTADEMEEFYRQNLHLPEYQFIFKYDELTDPNDPASKVQKTRSYAEVSGQIQRVMTMAKTNRQADMIMNEAIELTEPGFAGTDTGPSGSAESDKPAGGYTEAAAKLSEKYKAKVYAGRTGLLSANDVAADTCLGRLSIEGQNQKVIPLAKAVFALDELGAGQAGLPGTTRSKMWQNIGPARDMFGSIVAIVRVIRAESASEPNDLSLTFNTTGVTLDETEQSPGVYVVRDEVVRDVKLQKAMRQAKERAEELVMLLDRKADWAEALGELNSRYSDPNDASVVEMRLDKLTQQTRLSDMDIWAVGVQSADSPAAAAYVRNMMERKKLLDKLYSFIPAGKTEATDLKAVFEFKPGACYYVVRNVSRTTVTEQDYQQQKGRVALMLDAAQTERLLLIHLGPDNIFKRMNYRPATTRTDSDKQQPTGAS